MIDGEEGSTGDETWEPIVNVPIRASVRLRDASGAECVGMYPGHGEPLRVLAGGEIGTPVVWRWPD